MRGRSNLDELPIALVSTTVARESWLHVREWKHVNQSVLEAQLKQATTYPSGKECRQTVLGAARSSKKAGLKEFVALLFLKQKSSMPRKVIFGWSCEEVDKTIHAFTVEQQISISCDAFFRYLFTCLGSFRESILEDNQVCCI